MIIGIDFVGWEFIITAALIIVNIDFSFSQFFGSDSSYWSTASLQDPSFHYSIISDSSFHLSCFAHLGYSQSSFSFAVFLVSTF